MADHKHVWVQHHMETWLSPTPDKPVTGVTIVWRCKARQCSELYSKRYHFRKPSATVAGNMYGRPLSVEVTDGMQGGLAEQMHRSRKHGRTGKTSEPLDKAFDALRRS